jgi:hypothetical protein
MIVKVKSKDGAQNRKDLMESAARYSFLAGGQEAFCKETGTSKGGFYYWRKLAEMAGMKVGTNPSSTTVKKPPRDAKNKDALVQMSDILEVKDILGRIGCENFRKLVDIFS